MVLPSAFEWYCGLFILDVVYLLKSVLSASFRKCDFIELT